MRTLDAGNLIQRSYYLALILLITFGLFTISVCAEPDTTTEPSTADIIRSAAADGRLAYKLTTTDQFKAIAGQPTKEWTEEDGEILWMEYASIRAGFLGESDRDKDTSFKLRWLLIKGKKVDIGGILQGERQVIVKNIQDFRKIELRNVDLRNLNLTSEGDYLKDQEFDSLTKWPGLEKLPAGFDPKKLLEEGKNPGLGIRKLHEQGIDGRGIGIAILDQKLLQNHVEYAGRIVRYEERNLPYNQPLPMHGPPIVSIAVGKNCGVAPKAFVFYYAAMTTLEHKVQADCINEIIKYNETNPETGRIRVISISASPEEASDNHAFLKARKKALDTGIIVVTCSSVFLDYGRLNLIEGRDPDKPENYRVSGYGGPGCKLNIPTGNKTIATHQGTNVYKYERDGGHSWAAPYIAGLAALAFQVNPDVQPETIVEQLVKTATHTRIGPVVNPSGFIEAIKNTCKAPAIKSE
ncbi:MAG: S8 family serine peptidase [Planctomycetota bacterium]|nr:MAG: S8 family serine peptidase [Planctomycetota bacterium]